MLYQVADYARQLGLDAEPGFAPKAARWAIVCSTRGDYLGLVELGDTSLKKNPGRAFPKAPDLSQPEMKAGGVTKSHFLIDSTSVVAGYGKDGEDVKTAEKRRYFVSLLEQAASVMPVLGAAAIALSREDNLFSLRAALEERRAAATDKVTLQIDGEFPVESTVWYDWWRNFRRGLETNKHGGHKGTSKKMLCFLSGEAVEPAATHPKISGLTSVGGLAMGDVLVGFKQESFCSYGLEQSANAAMSELAAKAYQAGLNDLIANHSALLAGTRIVHWFRSRVAAGEDPLDWLTESSDMEELNAQARARTLLGSIRSGERPDLSSIPISH